MPRFLSDCSNLFFTWWMRFPVDPHPHPHLVLLTLSLLVGVLVFNCDLKFPN